MSTSSSEEGSGIVVGHYATSSGLESTGSLLFSVPSDSSDVQTEITPPTFPTPSEAKMRTPRDILDASRRLGQISALTLQGDVTPTKPKPPRPFHHRAPPESVANDEAGYDGDGDECILRVGGAGTTATTRPLRRPTFLRIDTRQHRRVASMLAIRRPSPSVGDTHVDGVDMPHCPSKPTAAANTECYELRRRPRAEPEPGVVGLGIGFPENHPLQHRAFTMPVSVPTALSPSKRNANPGLGLGRGGEMQQRVRRRSEWWFPSCPLGSGSPPSTAAAVGKECKKKPVWVDSDVCVPSPVRLVLRPTFLEVSPSLIECLSERFRDDDDDVLGDHRARSGVSGVRGDGRRRRTMGMLGCDGEPEIEIERMRYAGGQLDLSAVEAGASSSEVGTMTLDVQDRVQQPCHLRLWAQHEGRNRHFL